VVVEGEQGEQQKKEADPRLRRGANAGYLRQKPRKTWVSNYQQMPLPLFTLAVVSFP